MIGEEMKTLQVLSFCLVQKMKKKLETKVDTVKNKKLKHNTKTENDNQKIELKLTILVPED